MLPMETCQSPLKLSGVSPIKIQVEVCSHCFIPSLWWLPLPSCARLSGGQRRVPTGPYSPREQGGTARSPRQVQTTPAQGRQGAEGTDPHLQVGRGGNGAWAMSEGTQPTAKTRKDGHITHGAFTAILPHSQDVIHTLLILPPRPHFKFFSSMRGTEHLLPAHCHRNPSQLRCSCSTEIKAGHGKAR